MRIIAFAWIMLLSAKGLAQKHSIEIGTQVPLNYFVGYQYEIAPHVSAGAHIGLLTEPYSSVMLSVIEAFGTDPQMTTIMEGAFKVGVVQGINAQWNWKKSHIGPYYDAYILTAAETPEVIIEQITGQQIPDRPRQQPKDLKLAETMHQLGLKYGRVFELNGPWAIQTEAGCSFNIGAKSKLTSASGRELQRVGQLVDEELKSYLKSYAYLPFVSVALTYRF